MNEMVPTVRIMFLVVLTAGAALFGQTPTEPKKKNPCQAQVALKNTTIGLLRKQLETRDKTVTALDDELDSRKDRIDQLLGDLEEKEREIARLEKLLDFQKSLTKFQEGQIEKFREVSAEQRAQLKSLNKQLEQK
ncbi:hypothetical protein [Acanthopleuribacter pedis]|uniref:Uncharacterized protein n=1 Tax=Acanthopleuribacter pedis TaxID=442870 RepID=A0A8J7Q4T0_9BACT|nr:hypothetical protein [Acanthopleuribacter pedis]MBO1317821.1 hypothetical protein [Acanthopleuribacter pedis]